MTSAYRPGYAGPQEGYPNQRAQRDLALGYLPSALAPALLEELGSGRPRIPKRFNWGDQLIVDYGHKYVIDAEGRIRVGRAIMDQPDFPQYLHHSQLVNGANVYGAGWLTFDAEGRIVAVNDLSLHYRPADPPRWGEQFFVYLRHLLAAAGIECRTVEFG